MEKNAATLEGWFQTSLGCQAESEFFRASCPVPLGSEGLLSSEKFASGRPLGGVHTSPV